MTINERILHTLQDAPNEVWVPGYDLEKVNTKYGWIGTSGSRACRTLAGLGLLEANYRINRYVHYRITDKGREWLYKKVNGIK